MASENGAEGRLGWLISKAAAAMGLGLARAFSEAGLSLSPQQYGVLSAIGRGSDPSQAEVARSLRSDGPSVTRLVDGLARSGLVRREPSGEDRRAYRLFLTGRGRKSLAEADLIAARHERILRGCLPKGSTPIVAEAMSRILEEYSRDPGSDGG